jgi:hypothetical protein
MLSNGTVSCERGAAMFDGGRHVHELERKLDRSAEVRCEAARQKNRIRN